MMKNGLRLVVLLLITVISLQHGLKTFHDKEWIKTIIFTPYPFALIHDEEWIKTQISVS